MRLKFGVCGVILLAIFVWWIWPQEKPTIRTEAKPPFDHPTPAEPVETRTVAEQGTWSPPAITYDSYQSAHGMLPLSLEGTHIPFNLRIDERGELIVNENLRRLFDYFFTTDGEEPVELILLRIKELITNHLPETAQPRALEILDQYFELKQAEIELAHQMDLEFKASGQQVNLSEMRRVLRDLRATNLDAEVYAAFFGIENQRDDYTMNRLEIQSDKTLTEEERQTAMEAIEDGLPAADREHLQNERDIQAVYKEVEEAKAEGASQAEIFHLREQVFGAEAAQRYAEADSKKAVWDARIATYRAQRKEILNTDGLTESDKTDQIDALRQQQFEGTELKRIPVIDRMMDSKE